MNFLHQGFQKLSSDRQTHTQSYRQIELTEIINHAPSRVVNMSTAAVNIMLKVISKQTHLLTRGIFDCQLSKLPDTNMRVPWPPHRKTVGSLRTFMSIPEAIDLVRNPIAVFDSHWTKNGTKQL